MLLRASRFLLFSIVFFISAQVGYHFWPKFAYINGIRIDYLSPTLYLLDILVILFILCSIRSLNISSFPKSRIVKIALLAFLLSLVWNIFTAKAPVVHTFGILKLAEFVLFGMLIAKVFSKKDIPIFTRTLAISAVISSILAIWQFVNQSSVGGLWYFIGERTFSLTTIGISSVNLGQQFLRAYSAFPHPNVLAFFLFTALVFVSARISYEKEKLWKIIYAISILLSALGILLTFSRILIFLTVVFIGYRLFGKLGIVGGLALIAIGAVASGNDFLLRGIDLRLELYVESFTIFQASPYFGIGINNFFINQAPLIRDISPIIFQPPHNIFILSLLTLGFLGWWIVPLIFFLAIRLTVNKLQSGGGEQRAFFQSTLFVLAAIVIVGMFDHFFLTVEQGQIMVALILGLAFSDMFFPKRFKKRKSKSRK